MSAELHLYPLDVVFFRGTDPMNAGEGGVIRGVFPPAPSVTQGLVRAALLGALQVSYDDYAAAVRSERGGGERARAAIELIGTDEELGKLSLTGPYLIRASSGQVERFYPAPLDLARASAHSDGPWIAAAPGEPVCCDLGEAVRLATWTTEKADPVAAGEWVITEAGLAAYLAGEPIPAGELVPLAALAFTEPRIGLERDPRGGAAEGKLWSTEYRRLDDRHLASGARLGLGVRVDGVPDELLAGCAGVHRLGGEGRMVQVEVALDPPPATQHWRLNGPTRLLLLTPGRWAGDSTAPALERFASRWRLAGEQLTVLAAFLGRPQWIGGWNLIKAAPRAAEPCVPAGSVVYLEEDAQQVARLIEEGVGGGRAAGFGRLAIGIWEERRA